MCGEHQHQDNATQACETAASGTRFKVEEMTCDHCAGTIRKAFEKTMPGTAISIDLAAREVTVDGDAAVAVQTIRAAGYEPHQIA
ncbi:copper chaperone CopZ [Sinorhizobium kostiense]|uniref:Copper chaperone CopZ n=1 Tax=Sinorhizobium kostiense TaxID=76747 RepID=A0ABS4R1I1_9HYPH|nr:heavy metal-associated domain-containing protein [Sinorhizobium kostiense]MBP2236739.1 copper chaperone CopZ [Sinorhizobium kostiense]